MKSINNIYYELQEGVYKRYKKAQLAALSGMRPNPHDLKGRVPFLLVTPEESVEWKEDGDKYLTPIGIKTIKYDEEVLEIYSAEEDRLFLRLNTKLFEDGLLVEYNLPRAELNTDNTLTEDELTELCSVMNPRVFASRIKKITSPATLDRIHAKLVELDRKPSFMRALEEHRSMV